MIRRIAALSTVLTIAVVAASTDATAGCYHRSTYAYAHSYVQPYAVVQPVYHAHVLRPQIQIAAPAIAAQPEFPSVPSGATLTLPANFLGGLPGSAFMVFNDIKLPVQVNSWNESGVTISLPPMAIRESVLVRLDIVLPDGRLGHTQKLYVTAPAPVVLHPVAPTSPLPTNAALQAQMPLPTSGL